MNISQAVAAIRNGKTQIINTDAHVVNIEGHLVAISGLELKMNPHDEQRAALLECRLATCQAVAAHG